ncbi:hypothetical protein NDU88_001845 [Pleurodeles waltl]|uniref:Uncharacterized protein n=1 Tax=Pleurodeles waltl TaxID=8319 RepID=A0AAV7TJW1_PLEWA|nr:hypothetical protein NDU88_001845 [Pleurodeles waltl]
MAPTTAASGSTHRGREWGAGRASACRVGAPDTPPAGATSTGQGHKAEVAAQLPTRAADNNLGPGHAPMAQAGSVYAVQELLGPAPTQCRPRHLLRGSSGNQGFSQRLPAGRLAQLRCSTSTEHRHLPLQCVLAPRCTCGHRTPLPVTREQRRVPGEAGVDHYWPAAPGTTNVPACLPVWVASEIKKLDTPYWPPVLSFGLEGIATQQLETKAGSHTTMRFLHRSETKTRFLLPDPFVSTYSDPIQERDLKSLWLRIYK